MSKSEFKRLHTVLHPLQKLEYLIEKRVPFSLINANETTFSLYTLAGTVDIPTQEKLSDTIHLLFEKAFYAYPDKFHEIDIAET